MDETQVTENTNAQSVEAQPQQTEQVANTVNEQVQQGAQTTQPNAAQPDAEQAQQEDKSGEGDKDKGSILDLYNEDKKEEEGAEQEKQNEQNQANDYDNYVFERDGVQASPEDAQIFKDVARELDLSQEKAQKLYNLSLEKVTAINQQKLLTAQKQWEQAVYNDKEIGGQNLEQTSRNVKLALKEFGNPTFSKLMTVTGLGSHPAVIKLLNKVGAAIGNDQIFINGNARPKAQREPYPFYDNSPELK